MHALLFHRQNALTDDYLRRYAAKLGLDVARFDQDRTGRPVLERVRRDMRSGSAMEQVTGTPTLFNRWRPAPWQLRGGHPAGGAVSDACLNDGHATSSNTGSVVISRRPSPATSSSCSESASFALIFVLLMALPALPLPTGGATHVLEVVTMLAALELVRRPPMHLAARALEAARARHARAAESVLTALLRRIRWLERFSRPRGGRPVRPPRHEYSAFGVVVFGLTLSRLPRTALLGPRHPALARGPVVIGLGVLLRDLLLALLGVLAPARSA